MKTRILLTIGDFNGIGPEVILKTLSNRSVLKKYDLTVISPVSVLEYYAKKLGKKFYADEFSVIPAGSEKIKIIPGKVSPEAGLRAGMIIVKAVDLCMRGDYDAVVTAPISKEALNSGGINYSGHTEMLKSFSNSSEVCMMMVSAKLKVALATNHPPLSAVPYLVKEKLLSEKSGICYRSLKKDFNISRPKTAVLSLNPHAGEGGIIGREEREILIPAFNILNKKFGKGSFSGPFAADAYFASAEYKNYNLTFAMYHDQGLIPFKMIAGLQGINFTAGLSFVRTSPDHGTAFDIAGKNIASPVSIIEAIKWADKIFKSRNR